LSFSEKTQDGLKAELELIDAQYKCRLNDLLRKREEALESARRRWLMK